METGWYRLELTALPRGVVVAAATADDAALWFGPVASVLEEVAEKLPPAAHPDVAFLGDRRTHPLAAVLRGLAPAPPASPGPTVAVADLLGRYPVAGPLLRELLAEPARPIVLVTTLPPIDLADWDVPEVTRRTVVYRLAGDDRVSPPGFTEVGPDADLGALVDHLRDPVTAVRVGGPLALALDWDNPAYRWDAGGLGCDAAGAAGVTVRFAHAEGQPPTARATRRGGAEVPVPLPAGQPPVEPPAVPLSAGEANVLALWRRGTAFWCAGCGRSHPPGQVRCAAPTAGAGLFPSLAGVSAPLVVVEVRGANWSARPVPHGVVPLPDERVLVRREGRSAVYQLGAAGWESGPDEPGDFVATAEGQYLLRG